MGAILFGFRQAMKGAKHIATVHGSLGLAPSNTTLDLCVWMN